jgi:5,10-methylenetetrahydromethanopterin reductase
MKFGVLMVAAPRRAGVTAQMIEGAGFDTLLFPDSQNLAPEVWSELALAAQATTRIHLGPGVSNSVTRDAAVTAAAALTLQAESGGRAVLGLGRGDSSVQRIGKREDPVASFEGYLSAVQAYLRGEAVERDGFASQLEWHRHVQAPKVPVVVAATGRRVIAAAARQADGVCLAVGADPAHVGAMLAHARAAATAAGREPGSVRFGAFVNCVVHDDVAVARDAVRGSAASFARFSAFRGSNLDRLPAPLAHAARWLRAHYDMRDHTRTGVAHTAGIDDAFVDWFGIAGPAAVAVARLRALAELGLEFCWIVPGSTGMPREVGATSLMALAKDVLPGVRG